MTQPCDHIIAYDHDPYDGTSMLVWASSMRFPSDAYDTEFRYCPMCGKLLVRERLTCQWCSQGFVTHAKARGNPRKWCSNSCKVAAHRARGANHETP